MKKKHKTFSGKWEEMSEWLQRAQIFPKILVIVARVHIFNRGGCGARARLQPNPGAGGSCANFARKLKILVIVVFFSLKRHRKVKTLHLFNAALFQCYFACS